MKIKYYVNLQSFQQGLQNSWAICGDDLPHDYGWPPAVCVNLSCFCHGIFSGYVYVGDNELKYPQKLQITVVCHASIWRMWRDHFNERAV